MLQDDNKQRHKLTNSEKEDIEKDSLAEGADNAEHNYTLRENLLIQLKCLLQKLYRN